MAQGADEDFNPAAGPVFDAEVAYLVLLLDAAITRRRRASAAMPDSPGGQISHGTPQPPCALRPTRIELAVLTALAQTYGSAMVKEGPFTPVLNFIAERGAVVLVQRVLWGGRSEDVRLAARLLTARIHFNALCGIWPDVFMAQAQAELRSFAFRRPEPPMESDDGERDDG